MNRIGHLPNLDAVGVGLLISDRLAVRRPPVASEPAHLLLGDELGQAVRLLLRTACCDRDLRRQVGTDDAHVIVADIGDPQSTRREFRIDDDAFSRGQLHGGARLAVHPIQFSGQGEEDKSAVRRQLEVGEAADADALAFAAALLLRAEMLLGALEQLFRREQLARLAGGHVELEKALFWRLRLRPEEHHELAVGRRLRLHRPAEHEAARLGVEAEVAGVQGGVLCGRGRARRGPRRQRRTAATRRAGRAWCAWEERTRPDRRTQGKRGAGPSSEQCRAVPRRSI